MNVEVSPGAMSIDVESARLNNGALLVHRRCNEKSKRRLADIRHASNVPRSA